MFDTCFSLLTNPIVTPSVSFHFWSDIGEVSLVIPPRNFLVAIANMGIACFTFAPLPASFSIIGNIQQEQIKISYDTVGRTLGFSPDLLPVGRILAMFRILASPNTIVSNTRVPLD